MEVVIYLMAPTIILGILVIWALFWSIKSNQYEDLEGEAQRILYDSNKPENSPKDNVY